MTLEFPFIPASLNQLFNMHYRVRAKFTKERKEEVAWLCKKYPKISQKVDIHFLIISKSKHKKDSANYSCKAEIDGLVLGGLLEDDNTDYVRRVSFEIQYSDRDRTIINLSPVSESETID